MKPQFSILLFPDQHTNLEKLLENVLACIASGAKPLNVECLLALDTSSGNAAEHRVSFDAFKIKSTAANLRLFEVDMTSLRLAQFLRDAIAKCNGNYVGVLPPGVSYFTPNILSLAAAGIAMYEQSLVSVPCFQATLGQIDEHIEDYSYFSNAEFPPYAPDGYLSSSGLSCVYFAPRSHWMVLDYDLESEPVSNISLHPFLIGAYSCLTKVTSEQLLLAGEGVFYRHGYLTDEVTTVKLSTELMPDKAIKNDEEKNVTLFGSFSSAAMHTLGKSCARVDGRYFEQ
ncbi:MAG: hypothetical protein AAF542_10965 [Pseudomonadota bacterium]